MNKPSVWVMKENSELWLMRFIRAVSSSRGSSVNRLPRQWMVEGRILYGKVPEWTKTFFSPLEREDRFYDCRSLLANAYGGPFPRPKQTFIITDIWNKTHCNLTSRHKYLEKVACIFSFLSWRWKQYISPDRHLSERPQSVMSHTKFIWKLKKLSGS
jgi:hypothetical protein